MNPEPLGEVAHMRAGDDLAQGRDRQRPWTDAGALNNLDVRELSNL